MEKKNLDLLKILAKSQIYELPGRFVCQSCCNKEPQTRWFKQQKFIVSQ